ncbi:MAG TPA: hypothetical protein VES42_06235, partial [Pilimelia sp.]|nr:hypothetical protein [Pilimelia sp.]
MTRSEVERMPRAASRPLSLPAGGQMLRLPTSQAVAERTARSNDGAALRLGLRALAVVGFAGAAWLLCAGAAQAGDEPAGDTTTALSVVNLVPAAHRPAENAAPPASQPAAEAVPAVVPRAVRPAGAAIVAVTSAASAVVPPRTAASRSVPLRLPADRPGRVQDLA